MPIGLKQGPGKVRQNSLYTLGNLLSHDLKSHYRNLFNIGESCGIEAEGTPLDVEGQTRFYVNDDCKIEELVVTRTFSNWEKELFSRRSS